MIIIAYPTTRPKPNAPFPIPSIGIFRHHAPAVTAFLFVQHDKTHAPNWDTQGQSIAEQGGATLQTRHALLATRHQPRLFGAPNEQAPGHAHVIGRRATRHSLCRGGGSHGPAAGNEQRRRGTQVPHRRPLHHPPRQLHPPGSALGLPLLRRQKLPQPLPLPTHDRPHHVAALLLGSVVRTAHRTASLRLSHPGILPRNLNRQREQRGQSVGSGQRRFVDRV